MDHNPFISRNNDLFIMFLTGAGFFVAQKYFFDLTVQSQFIAILTFGFFSGIFVSYLYHSLEWAIFFMLGLQAAATTPLLLSSALSNNFNLPAYFISIVETGEYGLFLLSSWIIAIPLGFIIQKMMVGDYYRRRLW